MGDELTERLKSHARSFDSLLSLIPAKLYYGEDVSDQWKRKKQTPEQKRAAKIAKLDPDNWKSAKDVMDERAAVVALKRKREAEEDQDEADASPEQRNHDDIEQPKAAQDSQKPKSKKQKVESKDKDVHTTEDTPEDKRRRKAEERAAKRERKKEKKTKAKEKVLRQKAKRRETEGQPNDAESAPKRKKETKELQLQNPVELGLDTTDRQEEEQPQRDSPSRAESPSSVPSEEDLEEVFSPHHESGTSSTSSIQLTAIDDTVKPQQEQEEQSPSLPVPTPSVPPNDSTKTPQERLHEALSHFRADRKADGSEGNAPRNRQELLDQRRRKEEAKKAAKKEQRRREKEEEARRQDEEIERRFSPGGSGSLLASPRSPIPTDNSGANNFTFGRIAFSDGTNFDPLTAEVVDGRSKKGPRDAASQLQVAQAKKARVAGLDDEKRTTIEQKDMWLNAKRRAHGERVRDDTSLLKKALKKQQGQKKKSEKEWGERIEGVQKSQDQRQKKRNDNLAKRKEEKGGGKNKKVKRPGFEGSFKGRTGGGKKKS